MAGIVQGKSLEECVDMGQWLASLSITELGPSYVHICYYFPDPSKRFTEKHVNTPPLFTRITFLQSDPLLPPRSSSIPHNLREIHLPTAASTDARTDLLLSSTRQIPLPQTDLQAEELVEQNRGASLGIA